MHSSAVTPLKRSKCPVCGLLFVRQCSAAAWGYAYDGRLCCSYKCMRKAERADKEREEEPRLTRAEINEKREARNAEACRLFREGKRIAEIAAAVGVSTSALYGILDRCGARPKETKEEPKMADEKITTAPMRTETNEPIDPMEEIRQLKAQLAEEKSLANAAMELMILWKEKYELAERNRSIIEDLSRKEAAYFEALRTARPKKEAGA